MNPIAALLAVICIAAGAATAFRTNIYLGLPFLVLAAWSALSLKMANVWQKFVILRLGKLQSVRDARRTVVLFEPGPAGLLARMTDLARQIHERRVTLVSLVPTLLERLLYEGFQPPPTLRAVLLGGAGTSSTLADHARRTGVPLLTSYGLTESGSQIVARRYAERYAPLAERSGRVSSGHPLAGVEIKIVGGRIAVKTAALFSG